MSEKEEIRRIRHERLENIYRVLSELLMHEDERITDTLNIFVLVQTIFFAGFIQLNVLDKNLYSSNLMLLLMKNILPLLGALLSLNGIYAFYKRIDTMNFWRKRIYEIESDEDYIGEEHGKGLDIHTARKAYLEIKRSRYPGFINNILKYQRYYMAIVFLLVWILILVSQLNIFH